MTKQHMPYAVRTQDGVLWLASLCRQGKANWKLHYHDGSEWRQVLDNPADTTECNPVAYVGAGGDLILSYTLNEKFKQNEIHYGRFSNGVFEEIGLMPSGVGCHWNGEFLVADGMRVAGVDLSLYGYDFIYSIRGSEAGIIVTASKGGVFDALLLVDGRTYRLSYNNGRPLYKPCTLDGEWWTVITLAGNERELKYVVKADGVRADELQEMR